MSDWDGKNERRQGTYCSQHIQLITTLTEVVTAVKGIDKSLNEGVNFRKGVVISISGIILTLFLQFGTFCYFYGQQSRQVVINTARLNVVEGLLNK
jgi:diacylglycerol kinase